ncbi:translation initiation factor eIF-3b [Hyphopichia burtonii NRRL Y-1933]|uniref:Eukaryotic translation initiation factor 3 subunit B n=1 Tax=Hyphopichia burtonii NRRL Y-1933 TaxID=984485 RepID=A0A1E4RRP3_9ASCO|nr:translation initiation factor eIF-3b [Hyphopichia burtonii NRRL Y-1933]ODV69725.1 translation initiation factor eIF-3b [Hyphopichia burtonii NRRL Y-1933]
MSEFEDIDINLDELDFSDLEERYAVNPHFGLDNYVVVDGAPIAPESKADKLTLVLKKLFKTVGNVVEGDEGVYMPIEDGKTKGFLFVQFESAEQADAAVKQLNGRMLDQKHRLLVNRLTDIEKFGAEGNIKDEFEEPEIPPFEDHGYLKSWLQDERGRDQIALHFSETVGVYWNKKQNDPEEVIEPRKNFTTKYAKFTPKGTYLFSVHPQGVQAWGGADFGRINKFIHNQVRLVDFSPNENFMVTLSPTPISFPEDPAEQQGFPFGPESAGHKLVIWNLHSGEPARTFALPPHLENQKEMPWPLVKWSHDDKYCARQGPGALAIYDSSNFQLLDKKLVKIDDIVDFEWAPAGVHLSDSKTEGGEHVLSYWTPESSNQTARVALMQIPSRRVIRTINLFQVSDCKMHWQDQGRFLCVKVDRHTKSRKTFFSNLEFFRLTERDIPVEKLELKDIVINFAWEPKSERFITISRLDNGDNNPAIPRNTVSFYGPEVAKNKATKYKVFKSVTDKHSNTVVWSPQGRFVVVATIAKSSGELDFYDTNFEEDKKSLNNVKLLKTEKFSGITNLSWDPSGRFLAAWSSSWAHTIENGYKLYEFTGNMLRDETIDHFKEFIWRPRPESLLTANDRKKVKKNLREYSAQFDEADAMEADAATREAILLRRQLLEEWRSYRSKYANRSQEENEVEAQIIEEIKEEIIEEKEEIVESI